MALGVLISSFPYFGVPTLSKVFGYYAAPSSVQLQRVQISAQTVPAGGNISITLVNQAGVALAAPVILPNGYPYYDNPLPSPITLAPGQVVRAQLTGVDGGFAADLTVNLVGATAEGTPVPSGCGGNECAPPAAQLLFFKGSVQTEVAQAQAAAAAAAGSAAAASGSAGSAAGSAAAAAGSAAAASGSADTSQAYAKSAFDSGTFSHNESVASQVYAGNAAASATAAANSATQAQSGQKCALLELTPASTQTIPGATPTAVAWNSIQFDDLGFWNGANPTRITIPVGSGIERVRLCAGLRWVASAVGNRKLKIRSNGASGYPANSIWASDDRAAGAIGDATLTTGVFQVEEGMFFELLVEQNSGGNLDIDTSTGADNHGNFFTIEVLKRTNTP